jgi:4-hydroxy-tetrahydrodipicolinate synthase
VVKLAEIDNIVAIKEASGNLDQVSEIRRLTPKEFQIYAGDDSLTLPMLAIGSQGIVSVASHLVGNRIQSMIQAWKMGKPQIATEIHLQLFPLFKALFLTTNPIPVKEALKLQGWEVGSPRLPLCEADTDVSKKLESVMQKLNLI